VSRKTNQQKRAQKRKEARKQKKAKQSSKPKLFRKEPALEEALNFRHPLVECLINIDWEEGKFASIFVLRDTPVGLVLSGFVVDLAGPGLKDAWGNYGLSYYDVEKMKSKAAADDVPLVPCEVALAEKIVYGGIAWSKKWGFKLPKEYKIWIRILRPENETEIDLELFGENGKPLLVLDEDEIYDIFEEPVDPNILKTNIDVNPDSIPADTLNRIGDIKSALIAFSRGSEFRNDFKAAMQEQFGSANRPDSEDEWIAFQDRFVLEHELESGETVVRKFVNHHKKIMSEDVRQLVLGWQFVIEGLYEVKDIKESGFLMKNLINEKEYHAFPTTSMDGMDVDPGDFMYARIVPVKEHYVFSGNAATFKSDGNEDVKTTMYKQAVEIQMKSPKMAFKDNDEKLQKGRKVVLEQYDDFVAYFGYDEVLGTGKQIQQQYDDFFQYLYFEKKNPETGLSLAEKYERDTGESYRFPKMKLPRDVRKSKDVGMICDPLEGVSFLIDYSRFIDIFKRPEADRDREDDNEIVMAYLESESISDVPFRRVAQKYSDNFKKAMSYFGRQEGFSYIDIDQLMTEFKPESFNKLPAIVPIFDSEMSRLARSEK